MAVKIAVIEDDASIAQMYQFKLQLSNFDVQCAYDGAEGLKLAKDFLPDLILLDVKMPVMGGVEMLERLRAEDWGQNMRVIILTNISRDEAPQVLRFLNVDRYIVKAHHTPQQVLNIVREVLQ